jgi:hypothetical protein
MTLELLTRLEAKTTRPDGPTGCWVWGGRTNGWGYGRFSIGGRDVATHRVSFEIANGAIEGGLLVRHSCDNPPCWNPAHLLSGTTRDNSDDMVVRGRARGPLKPRYGDKHPHAKLSVEAVREIRRLYSEGLSQKALAQQYGVNPSNISRAINGKRWAHV